MNKLLALSIALLSVSLYGAEKSAPKLDPKTGLPIVEGVKGWSKNGLEGIGRTGLAIAIEDYSHKDKTFDEKAIENQIKLRLLQSGIEEGKLGGPYLLINAQPIKAGGKVVGHAVSLAVQRKIIFEANGDTYTWVGAVWEEGGIAGASKLRQVIDSHMDRFLLDYLKANPKKKEKE